MHNNDVCQQPYSIKKKKKIGFVTDLWARRGLQLFTPGADFALKVKEVFQVL